MEGLDKYILHSNFRQMCQEQHFAPKHIVQTLFFDIKLLPRVIMRFVVTNVVPHVYMLTRTCVSVSKTLLTNASYYSVPPFIVQWGSAILLWEFSGPGLPYFLPCPVQRQEKISWKKRNRSTLRSQPEDYVLMLGRSTTYINNPIIFNISISSMLVCE